MAVQKLSAFEKTGIQCRHSIKRLEVVVDKAKTTAEAELAQQMITYLKAIRSLVPKDELDVDLEKE